LDPVKYFFYLHCLNISAICFVGCRKSK